MEHKFLPIKKEYITEKGLSYVFYKIIENNTTPDLKSNVYEKAHPPTIKMYRMDMNLEGAQISRENINTEGEINEGRVDYYLKNCPNGIFDAKSFKKISIRNVYPGIDWVITSNQGKIKYDFVVHPGASPDKIKLSYTGAEKINLDNGGKSINISTPLGDLIEGELVSYQDEIENTIQSSYNILNATISFVVGNYDATRDLIIDPPLKLTWATYLGGSANDAGYSKREALVA